MTAILPSGAARNRAPAVRVRRVPGVPVVAIRVILAGGARFETVPGQAHLAGRMLSEGTRHRDWRRLAEDLEARGMNLNAAGSWESTGVALDALAVDWELALEWAAEVVLEPAFAEDRVAWLRRQILAELDSMGDQPEVRTAWGFLEQLYTPHPRARRLQGDPESLALLTPEHCAELHRRSLGQGLVVTVAGEIDEAAVAAKVTALFGSGATAAEDAGTSEPVVIAAPIGGVPRVDVALRFADQAHLYLGHLTVPRHHPDYTALELLAVILGAGSGLTGRIPTRIREKEGLAYTAYAQTIAGAGLDPGRLVAYVGTSPATVEQAERGVVEELRRLLDDGVSEQEVEEARAYLLGREPFRRETARQWSEILAEAELYQLPFGDPAWREEQIRTPDRAAIEAAARRHLHPDEIKVTVGRPVSARTVESR